MTDLYVTTSIPYVNGAPHLGHALELVQVDALARHRTRTGAAVRVQSGTDDHALKNVSAAAAQGLPVAEVVRFGGDRFARLAEVLGVRTDEFLRTSADPRHRAGVTALWQACARNGDLYRREWTGTYCPGCEHFLGPADLADGGCAEHPAARVAQVTEQNWFFRLSRYREQVADLVRTGRLEVVPAERRNEVLGFLAGDVHDVSVSRPAGRARGWGIDVPGDPGQVVHVWFDALANYLTGLGHGTPDDAGVRRWWADPVERTHVVGKGIVRFHAVHWPAFLLSAGLPLPTRVLVHDYLTVDGAKIAKSGVQAADPAELVRRLGQDAVRWWLLRGPARVGTTDVTTGRLVAAYDQDLANTVGNLASRVLGLARPGPAGGAQPADGPGGALLAETAALPAVVADALREFDLRAACRAIVDLAAAGNRFVEAEAPWRLARAAGAGDTAAARRFEAVVGTALTVCAALADELEPFVPAGAQRLRAALAAGGTAGTAAFPRLDPASSTR